MSEANRDEADKCKQVAKNALAAGDTEKALRFLDKAKRMNPGDPSLDALIAQANSGGGGASPAGGSSPDAGSRSSDSTGARYRASAGSSSNAAGAGSRTRVNKDGQTYTAEMAQEVQRILRTKDYYEILHLTKDASDDQMKKAYRKFSLKVHPDKNKAPGAEEAFKKVSKAFQCLQDQESRRVYDRYGDEERIPQQHRHHYQEVRPEDVFAQFFGGASPFGPPGGYHHRHESRGGGGSDDGGGKQHLLQMMPIVFLILLTLLSNLSSKDPGALFRFTKQGPYEDKRISETLGVEYFVASGFDERYPEGTRQWAEFEREVERYYIRRLHSKCDEEVKIKHRAEAQARRAGSRQDFEKARNRNMPSCKEMVKIEKSHYDLYRTALYMGF